MALAQKFAGYALCAILLAGCASTEMKPFIGKDVSEVRMVWGEPISAFDLPDGRRAFQYRWGGGAAVLPAQSQSNTFISGNTANTHTTSTPAIIANSEGCIVSFIGRRNKTNSFTIEEYRIPERLVC
ncbi:hypothetical protein [Niveispirillum sp. BGYR6]|uniref:hypothetical protein n=1 Tax=Niveispirillum sp. BGYR6 TaxID=2971249 RepID=UPI0022B965E7|nr:hypothetical protein [Niveispirillum sp. BGYR6]MDG5496709.1 hypothetical protein [Niveispirillum sp. BGYR6]